MESETDLEQGIEAILRVYSSQIHDNNHDSAGMEYACRAVRRIRKLMKDLEPEREINPVLYRGYLKAEITRQWKELERRGWCARKD